MQTQTTFSPDNIVKSTTSSRAANVRLMKIPNDTPVYLVCFGYVDWYGFRIDTMTRERLCATEGRAMKAAQKWVNA